MTNQQFESVPRIEH